MQVCVQVHVCVGGEGEERRALEDFAAFPPLYYFLKGLYLTFLRVVLVPCRKLRPRLSAGGVGGICRGPSLVATQIFLEHFLLAVFFPLWVFYQLSASPHSLFPHLLFPREGGRTVLWAGDRGRGSAGSLQSGWGAPWRGCCEKWGGLG